MNEQAIMELEPMVKYTSDVIGRRVPSHIDRDDLYSVGFIGLMEASRKFDASRGIQFRTYAEHRVKGAILDHLRAQDWVPRETRRKGRELEAARQNAAQAVGGAPDASDVANAMELDLESFHAFEASAQGRELTPIDGWNEHENDTPRDTIADPSSPNPEAVFGSSETIQKALGRLDDRERDVIEGVYLRELTARNVAAEMGVTEGRVSQIRAGALRKMRAGQ